MSAKPIRVNILKKIIRIAFRHLRKQPHKEVSNINEVYKDLDTQGVFDKIYSDRVWGTREDGNSSSGSGSHKRHLIDPYIEAVDKFLQSIGGDKTLVDLGCGDFNIGNRLRGKCKVYVACDISQVILEQIKGNFNYPNVVFRHLNLATDELPVGDVALVRQVLQHLSNKDIKRFVEHINVAHPYEHMIVTEHLPRHAGFVANHDKLAGPNTRVGSGSGIDLSLEPFLLRHKKKEVLCEVHEDTEGVPGVIRTTLFAL